MHKKAEWAIDFIAKSLVNQSSFSIPLKQDIYGSESPSPSRMSNLCVSAPLTDLVTRARSCTMRARRYNARAHDLRTGDTLGRAAQW